MRRLTRVWLGALTLASCARGPAETHDDFTGFERSWARAMQQRDSMTLEAIMAPDFRLIGDGIPGEMPREQWLGMVMQGLTLDSVALEDIFPVIQGDTAQVVFIMYWRGEWPGVRGHIDETARVTDTWQRAGNRWRVVQREIRAIE
jgi:hypothetical protein